MGYRKFPYEIVHEQPLNNKMFFQTFKLQRDPVVGQKLVMIFGYQSINNLLHVHGTFFAYIHLLYNSFPL